MGYVYARHKLKHILNRVAYYCQQTADLLPTHQPYDPQWEAIWGLGLLNIHVPIMRASQFLLRK